MSHLAHRQFPISRQLSIHSLAKLRRYLFGALFSLAATFLSANTDAQTKSSELLSDQLLSEPIEQLVEIVRTQGDARRGAMIFYRGEVGCAKCHTNTPEQKAIGPLLFDQSKETKPTSLIQAILEPSAEIKKGFESWVIVTDEGEVLTGQVEETAESLLVRPLNDTERVIEVPIESIEDRALAEQSLMPDGLVNALHSKQEFLDLARYVIEVAELGPRRAEQLEPPAFLRMASQLPEYESHVDHAGLISDLNDQSFERGKTIYSQLCVNCHGTIDEPGSLPTSLRFATDRFKNGSDPYSMYQTLTHGYGLMVAQRWMVPQQKYDVIHYIREAYLRDRNPSQLAPISADYLAQLPTGDTRGPEPSNDQAWVAMNYGPTMSGTFEFGSDGNNFAYKGIAVRLDPGPGGISQGSRWLIFDHDTMRVAGAWRGDQFIDWNGIHFNGRHGIHPRVVGETLFENPIGPGWAEPTSNSFEDPRIVGRDDKRYGPLPKNWSTFKGLYHFGEQAVISYQVGDSPILEMPTWQQSSELEVIARNFNIGPRATPLTLQVVDARDDQWNMQAIEENSSAVFFAPTNPTTDSASPVQFNGGTWLDIPRGESFDMKDQDFTIVATIATKKGGTIFAKTRPEGTWIPDGKTFFVRGGRLAFDIGWVGAVTSKSQVDDGKQHEVAMTYDAKSGAVSLYIDGRLENSKVLQPKEKVEGHHVRIGYTSTNFPGDPTCFIGDIKEVIFDQRKWSDDELLKSATESIRNKPNEESLKGHWQCLDSTPIDQNGQRRIEDRSGNGNAAIIKHDAASPTHRLPLLLAVSDGLPKVNWSQTPQGQVRLTIPAGNDPIQFRLLMAYASEQSDASPTEMLGQLNELSPLAGEEIDLSNLTEGGPPRWNTELALTAHCEDTKTPYTVDVFEHPVNNPWQAQVRLSGFDFFPDGDSMAVCSWDGDVWLVRGLSKLPATPSEVSEHPTTTLTWKRIASGMFQPLGLKIVDNQIFVTCRDQLAILRDLNHDGETDFYECFNQDHQVTEHFHEFAMGLQTDEEGNFYYAKSARHALPAIVPHHGTLLRIAADGSETTILANGFRAANGVCLNPDGTFIVTDQEGHWNPKNRINWVREGGFYGNMYGYHDVTDSSNDAMEQPLCWITNAFDRSPAELLWVESNKWGPLSNQLLNLSYGYGKIFVVPHETVNGQVQGGMSPLPIASLPTGVMRGRFHPEDGQLYTCGMFAWAGSQTEPGGFYRIRYTGQPVYLPVGLEARPNGMRMTFSDSLDTSSATQPENYQVKVWALKRTKNYGSPHIDEHGLTIDEVQISDDGRQVTLVLPEIDPTWCMEIRYSLTGIDGEPIEGVIHNTIHYLPRE